jgi:protein-S-isoprenylcysteine O-methyltransferase Ste14
MLQVVALAELFLCWVLWTFAFVTARKKAAGQKRVVTALASRWGIVLQIVGFALVWAHVRPVGFEKSPALLIVSMVLGPLSVALARAATRYLGKQWRYEAALIEDHELIQTGPYRWFRHPIYASMLGMLLVTGAAWSWWPMFAVALLVFLVGTEIRVRAEDRLLAERFQDAFAEYRSRVKAYVPFIR